MLATHFFAKSILISVWVPYFDHLLGMSFGIKVQISRTLGATKESGGAGQARTLPRCCLLTSTEAAVSTFLPPHPDLLFKEELQEVVENIYVVESQRDENQI